MTDAELIKAAAERLGYQWFEYFYSADGEPSGQREVRIPGSKESQLWRLADMTLPVTSEPYFVCPPWLTSVDAALSVLDKKWYVDIESVPSNGRWSVTINEEIQTVAQSLADLPRAILEAFLAAPKEKP